MRKVKLFLLMLVALLGTVSASAKTVYIQPNANWLTDGARFALYMYGGASDAWTDFAVVDATNNIYKATFDDSQTNMIFCRMNGTTTENNWDNKWNQSGDLDAPANDNQLYTLADGSWDGATVGSGLTITENYAEPVAAGYTVDFNTAITTSNHDFKVAKGWEHIVTANNYDNYGPYYMTYSYYASSGVDGTGCLYAARQYAGDSGGGEVAYDLLVTPTVNGTVTLDVKASISAGSSNNAFVEVYAINADGTRGELLKTIKEDIAGYNTGSNTEWATFTLAELTEGQKLGLRLQYVYVDNFTATSVDIPAARTLEVTKVANLEGKSGTDGATTYYEQQADGTLKVQLQVTLTNTGDYDFAPGDEGYSLTPAYSANAAGTKTYYNDATVAISEALAVGETKTIDVDFSVPYVSGFKYWFVKENISGTTSSSSRYAGVTAYEPKFIFRVAESTSTSNLSGKQAYGLISVETTKHYEIANTGTAPLVIKSITLPEGFTSANLPEIPAEGLSIARGTTQALDITLPTTTMGTFSGNLTIVYLDKNNAEQTYTLAFSGNVLPAGTWSADFNGENAVAYPAGSIVQDAINSDYQYADGIYDYFIKGRYASELENNKFVTPKLHATAGQQLTFDVKGFSGSSYYAKVYVSTDRKTWGEPVAFFTSADKDGAVNIGTSEWVNKSITFDTEGDYYVAFSLYGEFKIDNIVGLTKVDVAHDIFIKSVTWPDASVKSGSSLSSKPKVTIVPLTTEAADAYTVKYVCGETVLATVDSKALTASATSTTDFAFTWTPVVENTTVYENTKVVFDFGGGVTFETEPFNLTVTNEPIFHFVNSIPSSKWYEPADYKTPITFGKTNTADKQNFYVYNWGSAPLTVKSITVPAGFTATPAEQFTVAAFDENDLSVAAQAVEITFSATEAGTYSGDMVITYVDGTGADATFTLAVSGTKLDPSKWYANFGGESNQWPAGSVYQDNVSTSNIGTYSAPDYAITSSSSTKNMFVTPKLTAAAGDKLAFDAKLYNSSWAEGKVVVYAATTRDEVLNAEDGTTRQQLFSVSGQDAEGAMTTDFQTFEVPALAGDYYYGFEISNRPYVDEIYGLSPVAVAHEWQIASSNIPADATQNVAATATVNIVNLGIAAEAADSYTATLYIDGEAAATAEAVALPMNPKLGDAGTQLSFSFLSSKTGEYPVYIEVKADDYSVKTDVVNVLFAGEVFVSEAKQVGTQTNTGRDYGFVDWYNNDGSTTRYTDILYPAAKISAAGIKAGDKIKAINFKGTNSAKTFKAVVTSWVGISNGEITYGSPDKTAMQEVSVYNGTIDFAANEESVITLSEPIVWDGTSDIRVYTEAVGQGSGNYMSASYGYDSEITMSYNGTTKAGTIAFFSLEEEAPALSGTVKTSAGEGIEGATVTLKAENGATYSGTTAADGSYSFNVIQAGLDFTATVEAEGYLKRQFALNMNGASATNDVTMYKQFGIVGSLPGLSWDDDVVMTQSADDPNIFTAELNNVSVTAGDFKYKLRADGAWKSELAGEGYELPASGDFDWTINVDGTYNFKFTFDWTNHTLTFERPFTLSETADGIAALNWVDVTVEREFKAGWNAVVLPFGLDDPEFVAAFGANSEVAVYDGDTNDNGNVTVKFKKQDATYKWIEAGKPVLIWLEQPVSGLKFTKDISADLTPTEGTTFDFVGTYTTADANAGDYFIQGGKFVKATTGNTVKPFRSYLKLKEGQTARSLNFVVTDGEGETTGIDAAKINGLEIEGIYNLNGQKVTNLNRKGIYIINGKKVMVK